jgi:hypothetical protein
VIYILISTFVVAAVIFLVLYPYYKSLDKLDMEIAGIEQRIETQKVLLPLYMELVKKSGAAVPDKFTISERKALPKNNVDLIPSIFKGVARKTHTKIVSVSPDFTTLSRGRTSILINVTVRGDFFSFRNFLIELGKVPYVGQIEEIEIQQRAADKEFKIKLWLGVG